MGMTIDDEIYVHGYLDEIRQDKVIIRNEGGYFGTVADELVEVIPKDQYKARLKVDMAAMLEELKKEMNPIKECEYQIYGKEHWNFVGKCQNVIQQKINALKGE